MKKTLSTLTALSFSLFIYAFFRSEKTVINEVLIFILSFDIYTTIKSSIWHTLPLAENIIYSLPGGLWIFCATALARDFFIKAGQFRIQIALVPLTFAVGLEFCQLAGFTNGTFDLWDIAFYLSFWLLAYDGFRSDRLQQNILAPFTLRGFMCVACFFSVFLAHVSQ